MPVSSDTNQNLAALARDLVTQNLETWGAEVSPWKQGNITYLKARIDKEEWLLRVKSKRSGDWQTSTTEATKAPPCPAHRCAWILLDLGSTPAEFHVIPDSWLRNNIATVHAEYLKRYGGARAQTPDSTHHKIEIGRVLQWKSRWDVLGITQPHQN